MADLPADQVASVRRNVSTLVVGVDNQIKAHKLDELRISETKHAREVLAHVTISFLHIRNRR